MESDHTKLSRITFIRGLGTTLSVVMSVFLLRALIRGHLVDTIVRQIAQRFSMSETQADIACFKVVTANMQPIFGVVIILFMLLLFHVLLHSYKRYFGEVLLGIDKLMEDRSHISLSPELEAAECKLNYAKQTLKVRADKAKKMEQQKNNPVMYLVHGIKTPLTPTVGYLSLLDENPSVTDDKKAKYVHTAWEKANRLRILVDEFFRITRSYSESITLHKTKIDLYYMFVQTSEELRLQLSTCKKHIENSVDESIFVYGDPEKLVRVFNNILKNAISYNENSSVTLVFAKEFPEKTVIRFKNKGNTPNDKFNLVFDKFYRLNNARQSNTGGSGFGLAIAKNTITLHSGWIQTGSNNGYTALIIRIPSAICKDLGMAS